MPFEVRVTKLRKQKVYRRTPGDAKLTRQHAKQVGELVVAWNRLQSTLFQLFWTLLARDNHALAHGIWHCIQSDKTQREMLLATIKGTRAKGEKMRGHLEWIVKKTGELSPYRNDAAHTGIFFAYLPDGQGVVPDLIASRRNALDRLLKTPVDSYWRIVRGDLVALNAFATAIWSRITFPDEMTHGPLPSRPRLRAAPEKNAKGGPATRLRRKALPKSAPSPLKP